MSSDFKSKPKQVTFLTCDLELGYLPSYCTMCYTGNQLCSYFKQTLFSSLNIMEQIQKCYEWTEDIPLQMNIFTAFFII